MGVMTVSSQNFMEIDMPGWWLSGASVDLDFRNGRYYDSSDILTSLSKLLSISRASIGYAQNSSGTLIQFASNQLRITDLGLLIEDAVTNYAWFSEQLDQWTDAVGATVTANNTAAPNGLVTADSIVFANTDFRYDNVGSGTPTTTATVTYSIWLQGSGTIAMRMFNAHAVSISFQIVTLTASWARYVLSASMVLDSGGFEIGLDNRAGVCPGLSGGTVTLQAWGAQFEIAAFASSYIPTTTTSATRAADSVTITGSAQTAINNATGSIVGWVNGSPAPVFPANIVDSNGTNLLGYDATDHGLTSITSTLATSNIANAGGRDKFGTSWDAAGRRLVLNAGAVATDAVAQTPSATQKLGSASGTSNFLYAYIDRLALWNTKLAAATLQALTT